MVIANSFEYYIMFYCGGILLNHNLWDCWHIVGRVYYASSELSPSFIATVRYLTLSEPTSPSRSQPLPFPLQFHSYLLRTRLSTLLFGLFIGGLENFFYLSLTAYRPVGETHSLRTSFSQLIHTSLSYRKGKNSRPTKTCSSF